MAAVNSRKRGAAERPLSAPFSFRSRESGQIGLIERRGARRRSFKVWSKTMLKKIFSGIAIAAMMATTAAPTAALAHDRGKHHWHKKHERGHYRDRGYDRDRGYYRDTGYYRGDRRYSGYRCKRDTGDRKSTRLNSSHECAPRMPSSS